MKEWEYTFESISKAEWIRQVASDIRQKPVESLNSEWWAGEPRKPLLHIEDVGDEIVRLPDFLFNQPPQIIDLISTTSPVPENVNKAILRALQYGTQGIILNIPSTNEKFNSEWTKDVELGWINFQISPIILEVEKLSSYLNSLPEKISIRLYRAKDSISLASIFGGKYADATARCSSMRFVYRFPSSGNWTDTTIATFNALHEDLLQWENLGLEITDFFKKCILYVEADQDYFKQIIQTRTLHLLWQNTILSLAPSAISHAFYLETHIEQQVSEKPELFLIRASMSALAANLSGTGALCIHPSAKEGTPVFYQRINRNISHLLTLESGLPRGKDPLAGSFAIDYHTIHLTREIWKSIDIEK